MERDTDHRDFSRPKISLAVLMSTEGKLVSGSTVNLSVNGLAIDSDKSISVGSDIGLTIEDSQWQKAGEQRAEVLRCQPLKHNPSRYLVVIKLINPEDSYLMESLALIHGKPTLSE